MMGPARCQQKPAHGQRAPAARRDPEQKELPPAPSSPNTGHGLPFPFPSPPFPSPPGLTKPWLWALRVGHREETNCRRVTADGDGRAWRALAVLPPLHLCNLYLQTPTRSSPREGNPGGEGSPLIPFSLPSRAARLSLQVYKSAQPPSSERSARRSRSPAEPRALLQAQSKTCWCRGRGHEAGAGTGGAHRGTSPAPLQVTHAEPSTGSVPASHSAPRTPRQHGPHCSHKQFLSIFGCSESSSFYMRRETPETRLLGCFCRSLQFKLLLPQPCSPRPSPPCAHTSNHCCCPGAPPAPTPSPPGTSGCRRNEVALRSHPKPGPALGRGQGPREPPALGQSPLGCALLARGCFPGGASLGAHTSSWWGNRAHSQASSATETLSGTAMTSSQRGGRGIPRRAGMISFISCKTDRLGGMGECFTFPPFSFAKK